MRKSFSVKKLLAFTAVIVFVCIAFVLAVNFNNKSDENAVYAANGDKVIILQINNQQITVDGKEQEIDAPPVIVSGRTLVPIRAVIEAMGGSVEWNNELKETILKYKDDVIRLTIDSRAAFLNDKEETLDTAPAVIGGRTMLPIRFIAEGFNFNVDWNGDTQTITISTGNTAENSVPKDTAEEIIPAESDSTAPVVYMTSDISSEGLMAVYNKLGFEPEGKVAVKLSTGEPPASNYLDPNLIKDLVQSVDGTIVECNTAYDGSRAETAMHKQVAADHGFTAIADVDIMDEDGSMEIPIKNGEKITVDYVGKNLANYDSMITLSHFKGHAMGGFGGAIKNMSIGIGSREGKSWIHTAGNSKTSPWGGVQDDFLESMAEATSGVVDYMDGKVVYINVMNRISIDCDCDGNPTEPDMHDVGILASTDPVALDQACVDIVYDTPREESGTLIERIESKNGLHTLEHAEKIGLGSRKYKLVNIDE